MTERRAEAGLTVLQELPDISSDMAGAMQTLRGLVDRSRPHDFPSARDKKVLELLNYWLEVQKEVALSICPPGEKS